MNTNTWYEKNTSQSERNLQESLSTVSNPLKMLEKYNFESFRVERHKTYEMEHSLKTSEGYWLVEKKELIMISYDDEINFSPTRYDFYKSGKMTIEENLEIAVKTIMTHTKKIGNKSYHSVETKVGENVISKEEVTDMTEEERENFLEEKRMRNEKKTSRKNIGKRTSGAIYDIRIKSCV